jgi:hypothetical protein
MLTGTRRVKRRPVAVDRRSNPFVVATASVFAR